MIEQNPWEAQHSTIPATEVSNGAVTSSFPKTTRATCLPARWRIPPESATPSTREAPLWETNSPFHIGQWMQQRSLDVTRFWWILRGLFTAQTAGEPSGRVLRALNNLSTVTESLTRHTLWLIYHQEKLLISRTRAIRTYLIKLKLSTPTYD